MPHSSVKEFTLIRDELNPIFHTLGKKLEIIIPFAQESHPSKEYSKQIPTASPKQAASD